MIRSTQPHGDDATVAEEIASLAYFGTIIKGRFPKVKQRKHRGIASKCSTWQYPVPAGLKRA